MLRYYQQYTIDKFIDKQKIFICWDRQTGKNYIINKFLEYYVINNSNKSILFIANDSSKLHLNIDKILKDVDHYILEKVRTTYIDFINNNNIVFSNIKNIDRLLVSNYLQFDLIIYNDIYTTTNIQILNEYIKNNRCKCIFSSYFLDYKSFISFNYNHDFYINVLFDEYVNRKDVIKYYNILSDEFDFFDKNFERKYKLDKLSDIQYDTKM